MRTFMLTILTMVLMAVVTGCVSNTVQEQKTIVENLTRKVVYMETRDAQWRAAYAAQVANVEQRVTSANQTTETALRTAEEAVKTAEELKKQASATMAAAAPQCLPKTSNEVQSKNTVVQIWIEGTVIPHKPSMSAPQKPTPEKLREEITLLKTKIKKVQDDYDTCVIVIRSSYGIGAITQAQKEIEATELALKELEQELWKKMAELKKL